MAVYATGYFLWDRIKDNVKLNTLKENLMELKIERIKNEDTLCRVCMNSANIPITNIVFNELSICSAIRMITNVQISPHDKYSKYVCGGCVNDLLVALNFKKKCESTQALLTETAPHLDSENRISIPKSDFALILHDMALKRTQRCNELKIENTTEVIEDSIFDDIDNDNDSEDDEPLCTVVKVKKETKTRRPRKTKIVRKEKQIKHGKKVKKENKEKKEPQEKVKTIYYYCRECKLKFFTKDQLREHRSKRSCIRQSCPTCGKAVYDVAKHIQIVHMGALQGTCHICGKITSTPSALRNHLRTHSDKLEFACQHCPYKGKAKAYLVLHMRTHTGEKPYLCSECPLSFTSASNLKKHQRIHNEKPLECDKCGKKFHIQKMLQEHIDSVHLNIRYQCTVCDRELFSRRKLLRHELRVHKREKHKLNENFRKVIASEYK